MKYIDIEKGKPYCGNDADVYKEVLAVYIDEGYELVEKIKRSFDEKNWKNYSIYAHTIKSSSKTIGVTSFVEFAKNMEMSSKEGQENDIIKNHKNFVEEFEKVLNEAKEISEDLKK